MPLGATTLDGVSLELPSPLDDEERSEPAVGMVTTGPSGTTTWVRTGDGADVELVEGPGPASVERVALATAGGTVDDGAAAAAVGGGAAAGGPAGAEAAGLPATGSATA
ncbi:hypothetical protein GHK86_07480, partial [Acidimicrobiaceae bacterium USS-CC1]|nr:hypothetical protein [Acidiferrimicrobium australe]